jgi:hypothetical protein
MISTSCPKCHYTMSFPDAAAGQPVSCPNCTTRLNVPGRPGPGAGRAPGAMPVGPAPRPRGEDVEDAEAGPASEWVVPAVLLAVGLLLSLVGVLMTEGAAGARELLVFVAVRLAVSVPLTIAGMYVVAPLLGVSFGPLGLAVLKLAAISALTLGIATTGELMDWSIIGYLIAVLVGWVLFSYFFHLTFFETLLSLFIIGLIQTVLALAVAAVLHRKVAAPPPDEARACGRTDGVPTPERWSTSASAT